MLSDSTTDTRKPLGRKAYGHIPHLPGSRMGPGDHHCHEGQARIATVKARDKHDTIIVQEKLDGSCVAVAKVDGEIIPIGRSGYRAITSNYFQHILWHDWVMNHYERFDALLEDGERIVGEWLAQAHGTRYVLAGDEPFVAFDIMRGDERLPFIAFNDRLQDRVQMAATVHIGEPISIGHALELIGPHGHYGALDIVEGAVWRVQRKGVVDFIVKYVRPDKVDGCYLETVTGGNAIWNWRP